MKRFRVSGHSMTPALVPGQEVVATDSRQPAPGDVVAFEHPGHPGTWLIKRLADDRGWVTSDNVDDSAADSRDLGHLPIELMLPIVSDLDSTTFVEACLLLAGEDAALRRLIDRWGLPDFWHREPGFPTLALLILEQQVSLESGAAMFRRLADLLGVVTPESVHAAGEAKLHSIGVTRQKSKYLTDLAADVVSGALDLEGIAAAPVDDARTDLMAIKGIGPWTADAYLLSAVRRPDMWPVGDRALQVGVGEALGMAETPDEAQLEIIGEPWRPVRAVAARLIWHAYLSERGRVEPPDPTLQHGAGANA